MVDCDTLDALANILPHVLSTQRTFLFDFFLEFCR